METKQWRTRVPEFTSSRRSRNRSVTEPEGDEKDTVKEVKSVKMAPTCRYLSDRLYVARKPLFSSEEQTSILKKERENPSAHAETTGNVERLSRSSRTEDHLGRWDADTLNLSLSSTARDELHSPRSESDVGGRASRPESGLGSSFLSGRWARPSLYSSTLEVQSLNPPLRPRLSSTVLHPTYSPRLGRAKHAHSPSTAIYRAGAKEVGGDSRGSPSTYKMSPHQANYWACAIPRGLPPSPDRSSPRWDPNQEYQALLDYTYPLRPGAWDHSDPYGDQPVQGDPGLQDSGIELDHGCSSTSLDVSPRRAGGRCGDVGGPRLSKSCDDLLSSSPLSLTDPACVSTDSLDCSHERTELDRSSPTKGNGHHRHRHQRHHRRKATCPPALPSSLFPLSRSVGGSLDEEFRPLPDQVEALEVLSRQVREVSSRLGQPVWGTDSILSSVALPERAGEGAEQRQESEKEEEEEDEVKAEDVDSRDADQRGAGRLRDEVEWGAEPVDTGGLDLCRIREVEALVEQLSGLVLSHSAFRRDEEEEQQAASLLHHIQVFCSHLERLIRWLYMVSQKMDLLAPPTVDIQSVKSSLAEYQSFQRDVSSHQPLTSAVLQTGQLLLGCMETTSPVLRDTLALIQRQSRALESHTEHLFSSILSAMDSLTQPVQTS